VTEPTTDAGEQNAGTAGAASILLNFFEAHNVGHVIEALHYFLGHHRANPDMRLSVLLNALAPTELAQLCPFVEMVYPVKLPGYPEDTSGLSEADCLAALRDVPGGMRSHHQQLRGDSKEAAVREPEVVRIELLGGFRLWVGPRVIQEDRWRLRKARSLVKLLALAPGHRLHREQAMDLLWPSLESKAALNNLHQILHAARRALEPSALASSSAAPSCGYLRLRDEQLLLCPDSPLWVDVEAFEEAADTARHAMAPVAYQVAIDLYAGELLPQDRYEPWVEQRRGELRELSLSLLLELGALHEERGELGEAIEALERVVAQETAHEEAHVGLMRLYALLGRRREALSQYERLREALLEELGIEPDVATTSLQQEIWAGTFPHPDPPRAARLPANEEGVEEAGLAAIVPPGRRHNLPLARTSFIGRERETLEVKRQLIVVPRVGRPGAACPDLDPPGVHVVIAG